MDKKLGQVMTPIDTARFMVSLVHNLDSVIVEPSCGSGVFLQLLPNAWGFEIDPQVINPLLKDRVIAKDFFKFNHTLYDTIIGNPPYIKRKTDDTHINIHPCYLPNTANLYLWFINCCYNHLSDIGELIFLVPQEFFLSSRGKTLKEEMCKNGSFTHYYTHSVKWDNANVDTVIFRYSKIKQDHIIYNGMRRHLFNADGLLFVTNGDRRLSLGNYFYGRVGTVAKKTLETEVGIKVIHFDGSTTTYDSDVSKWPRYIAPKKGRKILVNTGPTRKKPFFRLSYDELVSCGFLMEKHQKLANPQSFVDYLNSIPDSVWCDLGFMCDGRWKLSIKNLLAAPLI